MGGRRARPGLLGYVTSTIMLDVEEGFGEAEEMISVICERRHGVSRRGDRRKVRGWRGKDLYV